MTLFARLLGWRLRFFSTSSYRLLERRWQAVMLVPLVLAPAAMPVPELLRVLGAPVLKIVDGAHFWLSAACWGLMLALAWLWTGLQTRALLGGAGWQHLRSLPQVAQRARWVDLAVFGVTDLPVLLPFAAALASLAIARGGPSPAAIAAVLALASQLPVLQCLVLQNTRLGALCVAADLAALAGAAASPWFLAAMAAAGSALGIALMARTPRVAGRAARRLPRFLRLRGGGSAEWNLALIDARYLFSARQYTQHVRLLLCALIPVALGAVLPLTRMEAAEMPAVLVVLGLPPLVLSLAALSIELRTLHAPAMPMIAALGVNGAQLRRAHLLVLNAAFCLLCLPLAFSLGLVLPWPPVLALWPAGIAALSACAMLNLRAFNQVLIPKAAVVACACGALLQILR